MKIYPYKHGREYGKIAERMGILSETSAREALGKLEDSAQIASVIDPCDSSANLYYPIPVGEMDTFQLLQYASSTADIAKTIYDYSDVREDLGIKKGLLNQDIGIRSLVYTQRIELALQAINSLELAVAFDGPNSSKHIVERKRIQDNLLSIVEEMKKGPEYNRILPVIAYRFFPVLPKVKVDYAGLFM